LDPARQCRLFESMAQEVLADLGALKDDAFVIDF